MTTGDAQPTLPLPDGAVFAPEQPRRRRSPWPWIITAVIVAVLAVGAWFLGEQVARGIVEKTIRDQVVTQLSLPADQEIVVGIPGAVIPQLIGGVFDEVTLTSEAVPFGPLSGDVSVRAEGVAFRGGIEAQEASAVISLDEQQLRALMATVEGFPAETLGIDEPNVTMSTELSLFGVSVPVGASLTPSASESGDLVLTPAGIQVAGADITSDELKRQFGILSNAVLRDWGVCIRQYIPAGITLTEAAVVGDRLVADVAINGRIASDPALREKGTCSSSGV